MKQIQHHLQKYIFLSDFEYFERKKDYVFLLTNAMVMSNIHKLNFFKFTNLQYCRTVEINFTSECIIF